MKARDGAGNSAHAQVVAHPSRRSDESVNHQEVSHVFHCMQCDLQFQIDIAVTSRKGSHGVEEGVVRLRLDPSIRLQREEESP